jgi:hypothetical protein
VVHAGYLRYRKKLLQCGVELYEANSKVVMRDTESQEYKIESDGDVIWTGYENGQLITFDVEPDTDFMRRLTTQIMRFMPIESQI